MHTFPERQDRQKLLDQIHKAVEEAESTGGLGAVNVGIEDVMAWAEEEGISAAKGVRLFQQLYQEGYFAGSIGKPVFAATVRGQFYKSIPFMMARIDYVTEPGLREIGQLPDPREELLMGLEAAIASVRKDPRLDEEEKRQKINWLQQIVDVGKQLTVEGVKSVLRGDVSPPGM
jgi:hypothetical protein